MALAAIAGAAGIQALGAYQSAKATEGAAKYNAQIAEQNAELASQQAKYTIQEGEQNVAASQLKTRAEVGAIEANQGASGIEVGQGSFGDVLKSAREIGMLDAMQIRSNAVRAAYGYQVQAASDKQQAVLDTYAAKNAKKAGMLNVGSTVLSAAGQGAMYSDWLNSKSPLSSLGGSTKLNTSPTSTDTQILSSLQRY